MSYSLIETNGLIHLGTDDVSGQYGFELNGSFTLLTGPNGDALNASNYPGYDFLQFDIGELNYQLWVKNNTTGNFEVWGYIPNGSYLNTSVPTDEEYYDLESDFSTDLNNDNEIGHVISEIEGQGSGHLHQSTDGTFYIEVDGQLTRVLDSNGGSNLSSSIPAEDITDVAVNSDGGFYSLWEALDGTFTVRDHDSGGVLTSTTVISGDSDLINWETTFGADLNNDGTIGDIANATGSTETTESVNSTGSSVADDGSSSGDAGVLIALALAGIVVLGGGVALASGGFGDGGEVI